MTAPSPPPPTEFNLGFAPDDGQGDGVRRVFQALVSALAARDVYAAGLAQALADLQAQFSGIATLTPARKVSTGAGLSGGGDLTQDRVLGVAANGVTNDLLAKVPALTLKANLLGSIANATDASLPALLDAVFGTVQGGLLYRGAAGWAPLPLGVNGTVLQSNGLDLVFASSPPGSGALRYDAVQTLTGAQSAQTFANAGSPPGTAGRVLTDNGAGVAPTFQAPAASVPAGAVADFAMPTAPVGWLKANGAAVSRTTYAALDAAIYVGDGANATAPFGYRATSQSAPSTNRSTTGAYIVLPDLRGYFRRGFDDGAGVDAGRTFGSTQGDAFGPMADTFNFNGNTLGSIQVSTNPSGSGSYTGTLTMGDGSSGYPLKINPAGGSETRPKNVALLTCIKT